MNRPTVPVFLARVLCLAACAPFLLPRAAVAQDAHPPTLEEEASAALSRNSPEVRSLAESAAAKYKKHDYAGALADLNRLVAIAPKLPGAYSARAVTREKLGDFSGAETDFKQVIELAPKNANGYVGLGYIKEHRGDRAGAAADYRHALQIDARFGPAYNNLGNLEREQKNYAKAEADFDRAITLRPNDPMPWANRAAVRNQQGRVADAMADVTQSLKLNPQSGPTYATRATIRHSQGDPAGALTDYRRAIELDPGQGVSYREMAYIEAEQHREGPALEDARRALPFCKETGLDYDQFLIWSLRSRAGQSADADRQLSAYLAGRPHTADGEWPGHVGAFLLGRESEESFFAHAESGDAKKADGQRCEAWYYAGLKKLFAGDKAAAAEHFRQCAATGQKMYYEYRLARAELQTL